MNRLVLTLLWLLAAKASAFDWAIQRFDGRDYVPVSDVARFYGFKNDLTPINNKITLDNGRSQIEIRLNSREIQINGVIHWLAFSAFVEGETVLISRIDLAKTVEPMLRPELIPGLKPVRTVVLDAGHGGHDNGAVGKYGREKDFALDVCLRARQKLKGRGFNVVMTRDRDIFIPLEDRPRVADRLEDSIFVSVHFNFSPDNAFASGLEIFSISPRGAPSTADDYLTDRDLVNEPGNGDDIACVALAGSIYHSILGNSSQVDRGMKRARFAVIRLAKVPAVLIEGGFVSSEGEGRLLASAAWRNRFADSIVSGIENFKELAQHKQKPRVVADYRRANSNRVTLRDAAPAVPGIESVRASSESLP